MGGMGENARGMGGNGGYGGLMVSNCSVWDLCGAPKKTEL